MSQAPNHLSPVDIFLQDIQRQQTQQALDEQYRLLANEMKEEVSDSIKKLRAKKKKDKENDPKTLLQKLINQGLAKTIPDTSQIPKPKSNQKGRKKLPDEITSSQYFKLSRDKQLDYDKKMATLYAKKGLGPYRSFKRKKPVNEKEINRLAFNLHDKLTSKTKVKTNTRPARIGSLGEPDAFALPVVNPNVNFLGIM